ncbi:MAG: bifunctional riboflavin kinase/FAD synthetase, partial [Actinomycetota bacterium]
QARCSPDLKVYRGLDELPPPRRAAVTVGNFDGVHSGHRGIIRRLLARARGGGGLATVVTFHPHPQLVLRGVAPPALGTLEERLDLLAEAGVGQTLVLPFDQALAQVEPEDFLSHVLVGGLGASVIVVGSNFRFGRMARGDSTMLRSLGRTLGYIFEGVRLKELEGRRVSSTEIRHALAAGDLRWANMALGRPHRLRGWIVRGRGRGRGLGYPTANLQPDPRLALPATGIYAGRLLLDEGPLDCAVSVGTNPTFGEGPLTIEAYALDFPGGDLYGRAGAIEFVGRLRDEEAFAGEETLREAIASDVAAARGILRRGGSGH